MVSLLIGGVLVITVGVIVFGAKRDVRSYAISCIVSVLLLVAILLGLGEGSLSVPNYEYSAVVYQDGTKVTIYFNEFDCTSSYVTIKEFRYYRYNPWVLDRYKIGLSPLVIEVEGCSSFMYEVNPFRKGYFSSQNVIEGITDR